MGHRMGEIFANHLSYNGLVFRIYKQLLQFNNKKIIKAIKKHE